MRAEVPGICLLLLVACSSPTAPDLEGAWGGADASLTLDRAGGTVQYACGAGTIDAWTASASGTFAGTGKHFFGGGPIPTGGRPPHPATYAGEVTGTVFMLTVTITDVAQTLGPYRLERDGPAVSEICQ